MSQNLVSSPSPGFAVSVVAVGVPLLAVMVTALFLNWGR